MKTTTARWGEGTAMATRAVLAARYLKDQESRCVTHAVLVDAEGWELGEKTVCGRIKVEALADSGAVDNEVAAPTCPACLKRAAR